MSQEKRRPATNGAARAISVGPINASITRALSACEYCGVAPAVPNRAVRRDAARRGLPPTRVMDIDHMSWCPRSPTGYMPPSSAGGRRG